MSKENENITMAEAVEKLDDSAVAINKGDIVKGTVISVSEEEVVVNLGYMADGIITKEEMSSDGKANPVDLVTPGDTIEAYVVKIEDEDGNVLLSKKRADRIVVWDKLETILEEDTTLHVKVKEAVKGGVTADVMGVRGFIPASQLSIAYVEDLNAFVGKSFDVKLIEFDKEKKKVILSRKAIELVEKQESAQKLWDSLSVGDRVKGVVRRLENFGAFIDLGGVDGLAHVSALSWKRVKHPSEVVSIGDEVEVEILGLDTEKQRISLKVHGVAENPWEDIDTRYAIDDVVTGIVIRLTSFGAFVELSDGIEALIHISQISNERISKPADVLSVGQEVTARIVNIDAEEQKMGLTMKEVEEEEVEDYSEFTDTEDVSANLGDLFGDKLKDLFKK